MIPKIIHFCWFGGKPYPKIVDKCIKSWKKQCPDYKIIRWDETNYEVRSVPYTTEAYERKKWAFVSDYARLDVVYRYGGIYLDTDVELIRPLDDLLDGACFLASDGGGINTGLGFGAEKGNEAMCGMLREYECASFVKADGSLDLTPSTFYNTKPFSACGFDGKVLGIQYINGVRIYPPEFFSPKDIATYALHITENTHGIHWESRLWETGVTRAKASLRLKIGINNTRMIRKAAAFFKQQKDNT